jgi:hypothetical protein
LAVVKFSQRKRGMEGGAWAKAAEASRTERATGIFIGF